MIRAEVRGRLAELITAKLAARSIAATVYRWPLTEPAGGVAANRIGILAQDVTGDLAIPTFENGPKRTKDRWLYEVSCDADAELQTPAEAESVCQAMAWAVVETVHDSPVLGGLSITGPTSGTWRLLEVIAVRCVGPDVATYDHGPMAVAVVTLQCTAEILP